MHVCETLSVVVVRVRYVVRPGIQSGGGRRTRERDTSREGRTKLNTFESTWIIINKTYSNKASLERITSGPRGGLRCLAAGARERRRGWSRRGGEGHLIDCVSSTIINLKEPYCTRQPRLTECWAILACRREVEDRLLPGPFPRRRRAKGGEFQVIDRVIFAPRNISA